MFGIKFNVKFKMHSYDGVLNVFTQALYGLQKVIDENARLEKKNINRIEELEMENLDLSVERSKAERMEAKLKEFLE